MLLTLAAAAAGCSDSTAPAEAAREFYRAVVAQDGAAACALLAPKTRQELEQSAQKPCDQAILEEDIPPADAVRSAERFGNLSQVRFGQETAFLAEFPGGWLVTAAGCTPVPDHPYDCQVKGG